MANSRMLHKKISVSLQVNKLPIEAQLLFTWLITHTDDDGRLKGEPEYVAATVVPLKRWGPKKIQKYLELMQNLGLIYYFENENEKIIEFCKWRAHQTIKSDRYKPSILPSFSHKTESNLEPERIQDVSAKEPQANISEDKLSKDNISEDIEIADEIPFNGSETRQSPEESQSSFTRIGDPNQYEIKSDGQLAAKEVWQEFEPDNPRAFYTTYLKAYMRRVSAEVIRQFASEMRQDKSIKNYGAVFNKKVKDYLEGKHND